MRKSPDCVSVFILLYSIEEIRKGGFFRMNITVYLGANEGNDTSFRRQWRNSDAGLVKAATRWCMAGRNPA